MLRHLIRWALDNPLVVILMGIGLASYGIYSFRNINVEAYPDPAPAIVEIIAQFPGGTAEEVERQVTVPLEVTFAGMPGLKYVRTKSLFGLSHLRIQFEYGVEYLAARQECINRLQFTQQLPPGVTPQISPESPTGEIFRYTLRSPKDASGRDIYNLSDLKALQDWVLEREFRRVPRIVDVSSSGGTVKRYEIHPDPDRLKSFGITLAQVQNTLNNANANVGGDYVIQGHVAMNVRSVSLIGGGLDPVTQVLGMKDPDPAAAQALQTAEENKDPDVEQLRRAQRTRKALAAAAVLRAEEAHRVQEIRKLVITAVNNREILLEDIVEGGRLSEGDPIGNRGVVIGYQTRLGRVGLTKPQEVLRPDGVYQVTDPTTGRIQWRNENDKVQCIVLLRKNEDSLPALKDVRAKVEELNSPESDRMLPGVQIEPYYDRTDLMNVTTETVEENLLVGILLVVTILFMFLTNVRTALIVALNIPLALLFAFSMLYTRGKSANLLSIGAVDFGIIVDSSVIMVENIYRHLSTGENSHLPLKERILKSAGEIDRALLFSTMIMVCAFLPLFTMRGPEGQLFGPMADTYAFSLAGALVMAVTLTPVLCLFFLRGLKPVPENFLVRSLKTRYMRQLKICLHYRWTTVAVMSILIAGTVFIMPKLGREFMPELEEGNLWIRGTFPLNISLSRVAEDAERARNILGADKYPEVESVVLQIGRPDDGTDPTGFYNVEIFVPLRPKREWRPVVDLPWWKSWIYGQKRSREKEELINEMNAELTADLPGVDWNFSQNIRDNVMESLSGVKGDNSVKIFGPDLDELEKVAEKVKNALRQSYVLDTEALERLRHQGVAGTVLAKLDPLKDKVFGAREEFVGALGGMLEAEEFKREQRTIVKAVQHGVEGIENVGVFNIKGQTNLEFRIDLDKCKRWGVSAADVNNVIQTALGGKALSSMIEGEKIFDITVRWPAWRRGSETSILDIPVDISNNQVVLSTGPSVIPQPSGSGMAAPARLGSQADTTNPISNTPRLRLRDLVSPVGKNGHPDPNGRYERSGASTIYREEGKRLIAVKFSVRGRDLGGAVDEARAKCSNLVKAPYKIVWSGEFEEMEAAEGRLMLIIPLSLSLIFILLYMAFNSLIDAVVVFSNVLDLTVGGIWALYITGTHFSISAAVGFVSLFGVAIMDGLLMISSFNALRAHGLPLRESILQGAEKRVRPVMMTALTAILGLLPAALSTKIGAQTQRPLAIVVVGGMVTTLFLTRYLMPVLYSFYGHREPPAGSGDLAH
jgi:cobalt-zinc-cadmium resistance protein CzcA